MSWNWLTGGVWGENRGWKMTGEEVGGNRGRKMTHIQKSRDLGGTVCSDGDTPATWRPSKLVVYCRTRKCIHCRQQNKAAGLWYVSEQGCGFAGLADLSRNLYRATVSDCSHPRGGSCGWFFVYTLSAFNIQTRGLNLPFPWAWFGGTLAIPMNLRHWGPWYGCAHANSIHSVRTSFAPHRPMTWLRGSGYLLLSSMTSGLPLVPTWEKN